MSKIKSKTKIIENGFDHKKTPNVTRYDFKEFSRELIIIQKRNKVAKKLEYCSTVNELPKSLKKRQIKEIMSENIIDERLDFLEPNPILKDLFKEFDERFFNGFLQRNNVKVIWNKNVKTKAIINQKVVNEKIQNSLEISLSRGLFKKSTRRELTESLLFMMIQVYLILTIQDYSINDKKHRNILISKIDGINKMAKTDIQVNQIENEVGLSSKHRRLAEPTSQSNVEVKEEPESDY